MSDASTKLALEAIYASRRCRLAAQVDYRVAQRALVREGIEEGLRECRRSFWQRWKTRLFESRARGGWFRG